MSPAIAEAMREAKDLEKNKYNNYISVHIQIYLECEVKIDNLLIATTQICVQLRPPKVSCGKQNSLYRDEEKDVIWLQTKYSNTLNLVSKTSQLGCFSFSSNTPAPV